MFIWVVLVSWRSVVGNVAVVVRCCCRCRAVVSSCHHGDGHASALISVPDCECTAFQGRSGGLCVHTQQVDLLTPGFKAAPPIVTSHVNANGSHRPGLTRMMDSVNTVIGIPRCLGLQGAYSRKNDRASLPNVTRTEATLYSRRALIKTQQNIFDLHVLGITTWRSTPFFQVHTNNTHPVHTEGQRHSHYSPYSLSLLYWFANTNTMHTIHLSYIVQYITSLLLLI